MKKFILYLDRFINLYIFYIVITCFLSLIPNINPDFPLFRYIFTAAGFYIIPPIYGVSFSPMFMLVTLTLISMGLKKIYIKYFMEKEPKIVILTKEEFEKKFSEFKKDKKDGD